MTRQSPSCVSDSDRNEVGRSRNGGLFQRPAKAPSPWDSGFTQGIALSREGPLLGRFPVLREPVRSAGTALSGPPEAGLGRPPLCFLFALISESL